jgi:hypothetical protein
MSDNRECSDCNGQLLEIRLIDKEHLGLHNSIEYAAADSKRGRWTAAYPIEGKVNAFMCQQCGNIRLYGVSTD